jgi:PAS domain S-box-containing protein
MKDDIKCLLSDSNVILNAVGEGIYGVDTNGVAIFINHVAEKMTGWNSEDLLGQKIHQYHHHSHVDGSEYAICDCKIYKTAQDGISRQVSGEVFWRKNGTSFPVEYTTKAVYKNKEIIGAVAVFRNVSHQLTTESALRLALKNVQKLTDTLQAENTYFKDQLNQEWLNSGLVGESLLVQNMLEQSKVVAGTDSTVLILGENGTGKELVARSIHALSGRHKEPLVSVNCAAFTSTLLESELFGHEKGAFTGAIEKRKGRFELAHKGTLFLDEIGELTLAAQSKLLRVLQEHEFERVGGSQTIKVDIRIIAATNRDLTAMVENGSFRIDLYYRLNVFPIHVPPLRERPEDIKALCEMILLKLNKKLGKKIVAISNSSLTALTQYTWPGNIRELQNVLEREMILAKNDILDFNYAPATKNIDSTVIETLEVVEKKHIIKMLTYCHWRIGGDEGASVLLGLPDSTLRSKMKKLNITRSSQ